MIVLILLVVSGVLIYSFTRKENQNQDIQDIIESREIEHPKQSLTQNSDIEGNSKVVDESIILDGLVTVTAKEVGRNTTEFLVELNQGEYINRAANRTITQRNLEETIEDITGFYGAEHFSSNKEYCVSYCDGYEENDKWKNGEVALLKNKTLLFIKKIQRPHDCHVSDNGIVICCDWQNSDKLTGKFIVFDTKGEQIFIKKTTANLGGCAISNNGQIALFETYQSETRDSNSLFIINVEEKKIIKQIERPSSFSNAIINTDTNSIKLKNQRGFDFEIDFMGNQINKDQYEELIMSTGAVYDCLYLYSLKPDDNKFNDTKYLEVLNKALTDSDACYAFGKDKIYRMIGEYYYANNDVLKTIEYWNLAIEINPKVGIKRKLEVLNRQQ